MNKKILVAVAIMIASSASYQAYGLLDNIVHGVGQITQDVAEIPGDIFLGNDPDRDRPISNGLIGGTFDLAEDVVSAPGDVYRDARDRNNDENENSNNENNESN